MERNHKDEKKEPKAPRPKGLDFLNDLQGYSRRGRARNQGFAAHFKHK